MNQFPKLDAAMGDGSWELEIRVEEYDTSTMRTLKVKVRSDMHIGGVILLLVDSFASHNVTQDWSDYVLWWPEKNKWLDVTRQTLDQYGVEANSVLCFIRAHRKLRVELPDRQVVECSVDFSVKTFNAVIQLCKHLGIRHPEELSFKRPITAEDLKHNYQDRKGIHRNGYHEKLPRSSPIPPAPDTNTFKHNGSSSPDRYQNGYSCAPIRSPRSTPVDPISPVSSGDASFTPGNLSMNSFQYSGDYEAYNLENTPPSVMTEARERALRPKNKVEKARMNVSWLDSSLSLMQQGVETYELMLLRFKFYKFEEFDRSKDAVRINQLYEQAKWELLNEELDCTDEEMLMFAAHQLQIRLQASVKQPTVGDFSSDDVDADIDNLERQLEGCSVDSRSLANIPELKDELRVMRPKRFTLKQYKKYYVTYQNLTLNFKKSRESMESAFSVCLKGCEVTPDLHISENKYGVKLEVPSPEGMAEYWIRLSSREQYARWMAAFKLASEGKTLADSSYESEKRNIEHALQLQHLAATPVINPNTLESKDLKDYVCPRVYKKMKSKIAERILMAHTNVKDYNLLDAKLSYIKAWQSLKDYDVKFFVVKFEGSKKEELLGVTPNRIMRLDISGENHIQTWFYRDMKAWNINWEVKMMCVQLESENIKFNCLSSDCKVVHEFIGGYIFLSSKKDANQKLDEREFHKLTGGWS